jgi:hypothetical protein
MLLWMARKRTREAGVAKRPDGFLGKYRPVLNIERPTKAPSMEGALRSVRLGKRRVAGPPHLRRTPLRLALCLQSFR